MKRNSWKKLIIEQMVSVNTYDDAFLSAIETASVILERRDQALKQWRDEGSMLTVVKTSDRGATNVAKNPLLSIIQECEQDALKYWTALGLTPAALKKMFDKSKSEEKKGSALVDALKALGGA